MRNWPEDSAATPPVRPAWRSTAPGLCLCARPFPWTDEQRALPFIILALNQTRRQVHDRVYENPHAAYPVPVRRGHVDIARVLVVQAFDEDPHRHESVLAGRNDDVKTMQPQYGPDH